ncbi:MAG TPA: 3-ketoacyl-ACP reductase [Bryobacteraceae bacterium]|nr:3-ketoacyl-ACP reductase [Bryobacteraceae bacterium]
MTYPLMSDASRQPVAIVTGGSRGIGRAIVAGLARTHAVVATYRTRREEAERLREETGALIFPCDLASAASRAALVAFAVEKLGRIDLLVNNAGMAPAERRDILEAGEEGFDALLAANLKGPYFLTQLVARRMLPQGAGRIVFITSISAYAASVNRGEYCVSKAGLGMAARLYAARLAPHGIGVFEVRPGIVRTDMIAGAEQAYEERIAAGLLPQRRMGEPEDVARAVRAIADGYLDYCAGQVLDVDGGFHLRTL